ncbi:MAG: HAD-IC family P-type ATPase [Corallococcus sp.]|nr:HAD-IC family P-type ATPase [Corallococcus sp.]MCM1359238.1 HAD-IC family P-type ATPase [Corallococcus sp.]MCM1394629.1 HAD-IC family P-type ATPase [Corallococcus sp.]
MTDLEPTTELMEEEVAFAAEPAGKKRRKRVKLPADLSVVERFDVQSNRGLSTEQVEKRLEQGLVNVDSTRKGKSIAGIIFSNLFTFFNVIYIVIAVILCVYGLVLECTFLPVVIANTTIAIVQEIKSKLTLDKLNLITEPKVQVLREGENKEISVNDLVLDDIVFLASGAQISADCTICDGFVEVNESILTGESDAVTKRVGDTLYAGSFVVSGKCTAQVTQVGKFNYISNLTGKAKQYNKPRSQMLKALKGILVFIAIIVVPLTVGLYIVNASALYIQSDSFVPGKGAFENFSLLSLDTKALNLTAGSIISMIPAGPFLLTSIALAASFLRLARRKTMVQELYCIEMLARVDTLCLDKTGTITDGSMRVEESIDLRPNGAAYTVREIVSSMNAALDADNMTSKALKKFFGCPKKPTLEAIATIPFSSERKLSAVSFKGNGTYLLGAPEYVLHTPNERVNDLVKKYAEQGLRVLLLAHSSSAIYNTETLPTVRRPVAVIVIEDHIRSDAPSTIEWFVKNGVSIKVISGDNPTAVSNIAMRVGVANAEKYISLEGMSEDEVKDAATKYTVFGRVSPEQKAILVRAMRAAGSTVAMTGDGVNDILAMKESDCSISLAGGSDAARKVSHLILMDDSFSALPEVVAEGRRVVNNIQSATSMYFMKTVYVIVINLMLITMHFLFDMTMTSPLTNRQVMLMDWVVVALPTTLLALQPNESLIKGNFFANVLKRCLPASLTFILSTVSLYVLQSATNPSMIPDEKALGTLVTISYTFGGLFALYYACRPFNKWKMAMYCGIFAIVTLCVSVPVISRLLQYAPLNREQILLLLVEILAMPFVLFAFVKLFHGKYNKRKFKIRVKK